MRKLKASALFIFGLSILFYFFFDYCKHAPGIGVSNPFAEDPYDAVGSFGIQLAFLSALLMLVCVFRPYPQKEAAPCQVLLTLRAGLAALLSVAITLAADGIGLARAVVTSGIFPAVGSLAGLGGGMALLTLASGWVFARAARGQDVPSAPRRWGRAVIVSALAIVILAFYPLAWRNSGVPGGVFTALTGMILLFVTAWAITTAVFPAIEFEYEDIFDDLTAIFQGWKMRAGRLTALLAWMEKTAGLPPVRKFFGWFSPRKHRWSLVVLAAVVIGVSLVLVEALVEGLSPNLGRVLLVIIVYVGIEGAGVALGYALLGKYLGIYRE